MKWNESRIMTILSQQSELNKRYEELFIFSAITGLSPTKEMLDYANEPMNEF